MRYFWVCASASLDRLEGTKTRDCSIVRDLMLRRSSVAQSLSFQQVCSHTIMCVCVRYGDTALCTHLERASERGGLNEVNSVIVFFLFSLSLSFLKRFSFFFVVSVRVFSRSTLKDKKRLSQKRTEIHDDHSSIPRASERESAHTHDRGKSKARTVARSVDLGRCQSVQEGERERERKREVDIQEESPSQ